MHYARELTAQVLLAALLLAAAAPAAHATDYHWIGAGTGGNIATEPLNTTTQWNNPANWQEGKVPTSTDKAILPLANAGYVNAQTAVVQGLRVDGPSQDGAFYIGAGAAVSTPGGWGVNVGLYSQGRILQTGGSLTVGAGLSVGAGAGGNGSYRLEGGTLTSKFDEYIGYLSTGTFTQTGGTHIAQGALNVGYGGKGVLNMGGGTLTAGSLIVGFGGTLNVTNAQAVVRAGQFTLQPGSSLTGVAGSQVHIISQNNPYFYIYSQDEAALAGLADLTVVFDGDTTGWIGALEVAGADRGPTLAGFEDNFALGGLVLGYGNPARVALLDRVDNGNRSSAEALYVHNLTIGAGSRLDLGGLNLYYDGTLLNQGTIIGGSPQFVPEPATVGILVAGLAGLLIRTGRKAWA